VKSKLCKLLHSCLVHLDHTISHCDAFQSQYIQMLPTCDDTGERTHHFQCHGMIGICIQVLCSPAMFKRFMHLAYGRQQPQTWCSSHVHNLLPLLWSQGHDRQEGGCPLQHVMPCHVLRRSSHRYSGLIHHQANLCVTEQGISVVVGYQESSQHVVL